MESFIENIKRSWDNIKSLFNSTEGKWLIGLLVALVVAVIWVFKIPIWRKKFTRRRGTFRRRRRPFYRRFYRRRRRR